MSRRRQRRRLESGWLYHAPRDCGRFEWARWIWHRRRCWCCVEVPSGVRLKCRWRMRHHGRRARKTTRTKDGGEPTRRLFHGTCWAECQRVRILGGCRAVCVGVESARPSWSTQVLRVGLQAKVDAGHETNTRRRVLVRSTLGPRAGVWSEVSTAAARKQRRVVRLVRACERQ